MRKGLLAALRWTGRGALALLLAALALAAALICRPEWFLTPRVLTALTQRYGGAYHLTWSAYAPSLRSVTLLDKQLSVTARDLCFRDARGSIDGCINSVDAAVTLRLGWPLRVASVDWLRLDGRRLTVDQTRRPPPRKMAAGQARPRRHGLAGLIPKPLRHARIGPLAVTLPDTVLVLTSTSALSGDLSLSYSTAQAPPLDVRAQLYYETPDTGENLAARVFVDSDYFKTGRLRNLRAQGRVTGDAGDSASFEARLAQRSRRETLVHLTARARSGTRGLRAALSGSVTPGALRARVTGDVADSTGTLRELALSACQVNAFLGAEQELRALDADCRVTAQPAALASPAGRPPETLAARVRLDGKVAAGDRFDATLKAALEPVKRWFDFRAELTAKLSGRLHDLPRSLQSRHSLQATLSVPKFQDLVAYLRGTPYSVPAPFHVLNGPVQLVLRSEGDTSKADQLFTYQAKTDLTSGRQKVVVAIDGKVLAKKLFLPQRRFEDSTEVVLENVALELPYLKIGTPPPVTLDSRIRTGGEPPPAPQPPGHEPSPVAAEAQQAVSVSTESHLSYTARVRTAKPVLLYTNLNPTPIPVALDVSAAPAGASGSVRIEPFVAELFKRKAEIDHVTITLDPGAKQLNLDGLIKITMPDALITLKLLGTTDKPQVVFESDPPMNQQDIVAMLIFGKTPADLDPDQKTTASNSQSALASGAFGFASLYLFASTPIQYVGYDPTTQTYAMKFTLPGGASLEVGSDVQQQSHLTLRKRLARHWVIATEYQRTGGGAPTTSGPAQNAVTTFLEWFQRY